MSSEDHYFQFPLCALALPCNEVDTIISYGFVEAGASVVRSADNEARESLCAEHGLPKNKRDSWELAAEVGAEVCGITVGNREASIQRHDTLAKHLTEWEERHGKDPLVRIERDLCFNAHDNDGFSLREFRVLCAIYSAIGGKSYPVILPLRMIDARSCGCKSEAVLTTELSGSRALDRLTTKQLRGTVERLHELKFFARCTPYPHGRKTYYSHRMSEDELRERIAKKVTYATGFKHRVEAMDAELRARIDSAKKSPIKGAPPIKGALLPTADVTTPKKGRQEGNAAAPQGQQEGTVRAPIIEIPLIEILPNRNPLNKNPIKELPPNPQGGNGDYQEKGIEEHSDPIPWTPPKAEAKPENGYLYKDRFLTSQDINNLVRECPERAGELLNARRARRFPDGRIEPAT